MRFPPPLRIGIPAVLLIFGLLAGFASYFYAQNQEQQYIEAKATERMRFLGTKVTNMTSFLLEMNSPEGAQRELSLAATLPDLRYALIFNEQNQVKFTSRNDQLGLSIHDSLGAGSAELVQRARQKSCGQIELGTDGQSLVGAFPFSIIAPGQLQPSGVCVLLLNFDILGEKFIMHADDMRRMQVGGGVLLALAIVFSVILHYMLTARMCIIVEASKQFTKGQFDVRVRLKGADEIAQMGEAFDAMAAQLQQRDEDLHAGEQKFRQMAENIGEIFWLYDFDAGRALYVNPAFERIFGLPAASYLSATSAWRDAIHPEDSERVLAAFALEREGPRETEYRIIHKDGSVRWLRDRSFPVRGQDGVGRRVAGVAEDITARKQGEEEKAAFERKLEETQRLESLGVLAGGIAHDFNNLLTGVLGNASLARMALPQGDEAQKYLAQIEAVTIRAADLCKQMLAYSGKGRFTVQLLDVSAIVEETTQLLHISIAKGAVLRFNLAKNLPPIKADPTQIRQVVMNLVINASEALAGKSGTISLNTGVVRVDREYLSNTVLADEIPEGDYVFLEVADNGCGMSAETQSRIFEPFYTTKFAGRGLGLSAVLGIVRGHSGAMKVYSESGKGTMFKLLFPVAEGHAQPVQKDATDEAKWRGAGSILIVDDEETVRAVCARMVESFGFKVILAADGTEGIARFRERRAEISAVLMDLTMPHIDGEEAFRQIRAMDPGVHVLLMSGFNEQEAINRFTGKGLAGFLQKPFRTEQLRAKLRQLLAGA